MSREKKESVWDEMTRLLQSEATEANANSQTEPPKTDVPESVAEPSAEKKTKKSAASTSKGKEKKGAELKKTKSSRVAKKPSVAKLTPEATAALTRDPDRVADSFDVSTLASEALAREVAEAEGTKSAPKRRRRPRPETAEEEQEEKKTFGDLLAQVARVAQGKKPTKKSVRAPRSEATDDTVETRVEDVAPETTEAMDDTVETRVEIVAPETTANETSALDLERVDADANLAEVDSQETDFSLSDDFWNDSPFEQEQKLLNDILGFGSPSVKDGSDSGKSEPIVEEETQEEEPQEEEAVSEEESLVGEFDDFWKTDDTIDLAWGANAKVEETEDAVAEFEEASETPAEVAPNNESDFEDAVEDESESESEEETPAAELEPSSSVNVADVDFDDPDTLNAFFSAPESEDLGFAPRKKVEPKPSEKKRARETSESFVAPTVDEENVASERAKESANARKGRRAKTELPHDAERSDESPRESREPRGGGRRRFEEAEEPRESHEPRGGGRRRFEEAEEPRESHEPRGGGRRRFEETEEPRESHEPRGGGRRRFEEAEEPRESREPRGGGRRRFEEAEEPRDNDRDVYEEQREEAPRDKPRRGAENASVAGNAPELLIPSWDDAVSYVVKFNLGRRLNHGRDKK